MTIALQTRSRVKKFGGFGVTNDAALKVSASARHALICPNGARTTTWINLLAGFLAPTSGSVSLSGEEVTQVWQHRRVKRGMACRQARAASGSRRLHNCRAV